MYHIYARCSTEEQAISYLGIEAQIASCKAWIDKNDPGADYEEYIDAGVSSTKIPAAIVTGKQIS